MWSIGRLSVLRNMSVSLAVFAWIVVFASTQMHNVQGAAVMSIDLGTEWMKVGVVSPGVPMEIVLNRESKRKTPALVAFREGMRAFGEDAVTAGIRDPATSFGYLLDLLGKTIDNPIVDLYRKRFPYYDIIADPHRNTLIFKKSETEQYSVEELVAQILVQAKYFAQESTRQVINEAVLTVPGYFGQAEREALISAANLASIKVLQLINDYTAVALNYGVFHRGEINETAQYYIFYDMGAYKTSAAVVSFQLVKDKQTKEANPVIQVLGVGYDRTLGGLEIQLRLRDYLAAEFNAMKKTTKDVTKNPRALAKLFKEAGRVKNVLSANNVHFAQIENLLEDHDFKVQVTREKLEELCADMWPRVTKPLEQALAASGLSLNLISQVILFGGGTRVPKVQDTIKETIKQELGKSLNADEAATMGAVYKAADLATGFKVKKFIIKDAVIFPIQVTFERHPGDGSGVKQVKRLLFGHMNSYPQKKVITFNKHTDDFDFYVHYGDMTHLSVEEISYIGGLNISRVQLLNINEMLEKHQKIMMYSKGIKVYFLLDESGIFRCTGVDFVFEKQKTEDEGTLAKLGSTISKLFSKDGDKKEEEGSGTPIGKEELGEEKLTEADGEKTEADNIKAGNKTDQKFSDKEKPNAKNETVKIVTIKEPVPHRVTIQYTLPLAGDAYDSSFSKLIAINEAEVARSHLESSLNALESHVVEMQQKLSEEEYASCITAEEKHKILDECERISEWLYEDQGNPTYKLYEKRLKDLKALTNVVMGRHWEHEERPEALTALSNLLDGARKFLASAKNLTKATNAEKDVFTEVEIEVLSKVIDETAEWQKEETEAQNKLKRHENVRLTVQSITDKMAILDREVKYLVNKIKNWKPKSKPTKKPRKEDNKTEEAESLNGSGSGVGSQTETFDNNTKEEHVEILETQNQEPNEATLPPAPTPSQKSTPHSEL